MKAKTEFKMSELIDGLQINVVIKTDKFTTFRIWLGIRIIKLASFVMGIDCVIHKEQQ